MINFLIGTSLGAIVGVIIICVFIGSRGED